MSVPAQSLATYSLVTFRNNQGENARGTILKITRTIIAFEVYTPYLIAQVSEVLQDVTLWRQERIIYQGRGVVNSLFDTGTAIIVTVSLHDNWIDLASLLMNGLFSRKEVDIFINEWDKAHELKSDYLLAVTDVRSFLVECNRWLSQVDLFIESDGIGRNTSLYEEVFEEISSPLLPKFEELFEKFEDAASTLTEDEEPFHKNLARRDLHPLLLTAPYVYRSYEKPLGYAGDYEMVNMIFRDSREGSTIYAKIINTFYLNTAVAKAHRNRIDILTSYIDNALAKAIKEYKRPRILNIGCGPAVEIKNFICNNVLARYVDFQLLDFNEETLQYTKAKIDEVISSTGRSPSFQYIHQSVHSIVKQARKHKQGQDQKNIDLEEYDFIYCAGLFDYLSDTVCSSLIDMYYKRLLPGGRMLFSNVHTRNPCRWNMEHIGEWYLVYRNERDMSSLYRIAPNNKKVFTDATRVNVFLEIIK